MLCGTGYLAQALTHLAPQPILVDFTPELLYATESPGFVPREEDVLREAGPHETVDALVSLAGLHHLYIYNTGPDVGMDYVRSVELQVGVVLRWARLLNPNGIMVIADVPDLDTPADFGDPSSIRMDLELALAWEPDLRESVERLGAGSVASGIESLQDYVTSSVWRDLEKADAQVPRDFFENVVRDESSAGHDGLFVRTQEICQALAAAGFAVTASVVPTPWVFASAQEAAWFLRELFSLGWPIAKPRSFAKKRASDFINGKVKPYLGCTDLPGGRNAVWWQLVYIIVSR